MRFGLKLVQLRESMLKEHAQPPTKRWDFDWYNMLHALERIDWTDVWEDAELQTVCHYLRGAKSLELPKEVRKLLPTAI